MDVWLNMGRKRKEQDARVKTNTLVTLRIRSMTCRSTGQFRVCADNALCFRDETKLQREDCCPVYCINLLMPN